MADSSFSDFQKSLGADGHSESYSNGYPINQFDESADTYEDSDSESGEESDLMDSFIQLQESRRNSVALNPGRLTFKIEDLQLVKRFTRVKDARSLSSQLTQNKSKPVVFTGSLNFDQANELKIKLTEKNEAMVRSNGKNEFGPQWLSFENVPLQHKVCLELLRGLGFLKLVLLDLKNCKIGPIELDYLGILLSRAQTLEELCLKSNSITLRNAPPEQNISGFGEHVASAVNLKSLDISYNPIESTALAQFLHHLRGKKLRFLNLSHTKLQTAEDISVVAEYLRHNDCFIRTLVLDDLQLGDDAGEVLATSIQANFNLQSLYLRKNNLTKFTAKAFVRVITLTRQNLTHQVERRMGRNNLQTSGGNMSGLMMSGLGSGSTVYGGATDMRPLNKSLKSLDLSDNNIDYSYIEMIGAALNDDQRHIYRKEGAHWMWDQKAWNLTQRNAAVKFIYQALRGLQDPNESGPDLAQSMHPESKVSMLEALIESASYIEPDESVSYYVKALRLLFDRKIFTFQEKNHGGLSMENLLENHIRYELRDFAKRLHALENKYCILNNEPIHKSNTSEVVHGLNVDTKKAVAIKIVHERRHFEHELEMRNALTRALSGKGMLGKFKKYVVAHDFHSQPDADSRYFVFPLMEKSLYDTLNTEKRFLQNISVVRRVATDAAAGLEVLNTLGFIHGDFKLRNILREALPPHADKAAAPWKLIDFDNCYKHGSALFQAGEPDPKFSSAYCAPEVGRKLFINNDDTELIANEKMDVFSYGIVLYEMCSGVSLFPAKHLSDNIYDQATRVNLVNWVGLNKDQLEQLFYRWEEANTKEVNYAKDLIIQCLHGAPKDRPTFKKILEHPFLMPSAQRQNKISGNFSEKTHLFLSHVQAEAAGTVKDIYYFSKRMGCACWLDMTAKDLTAGGMFNGVDMATNFIVILTKHIFDSAYCVLELLWAIDLRKPIVPILEVETRDGFYAFDKDYFNAQWKDIHSPALKSIAENLSKISKLKFTGELRKRFARWNSRKLDRLANILIGIKNTYINKLVDVRNCIPYRRRNYEQKAMMNEIMRRINFQTNRSLLQAAAERARADNQLTTRRNGLRGFTVVILVGPNYKHSDTGFNDMIENIRQKLEPIDDAHFRVIRPGQTVQPNSKNILLLLMTPRFFDTVTCHSDNILQHNKLWMANNLPIIAVEYGWYSQDQKYVEQINRSGTYDCVFLRTEIMPFRGMDAYAFEHEGMIEEVVSRIKRVIRMFGQAHPL